MAEEFKDGLEHLPLPERVALRAEALADLAAKVTGVDTGRTEAERRVACLEARVGELNQTIGDLRAGWRDADQQHARDVELLLWLHAEAAWQREQAVMAEALRWRKIVEQWEQGHQNEVLPYTAKLEAEVAGLKAAIADIDAHATRVGLLHNDDPEGSPHHYLLTVGALHRALGKAYTAEPCESERARLRVESARSEASRQAWAEEAMRQSSELNDYADLLLTCAESPSPERLARVLRRMAARRPQSCPFVSDSGNCCECDEGHDGPHLRWFDEIRYEVLAASTACACVSDEQAAVIVAGGFSRPQCAVHPEAGGE